MAAIGHFPKKQRFRGKKIGWLKADVLEWMTRTTRHKVGAASDKRNSRQRAKSKSPNQQVLPLKYASAQSVNGHTPTSTVIGVSP
jgi:hypothetical protein